MTNSQSVSKTLLAILAAAIIIILAYGFLTMKDNRSTTDRLGDAVHALPQGLDKASEQMEDRTPGQKLGDAVEDAGSNIKKDTAPQ
jgi:hypothetical protein